MKLSVGWGTLPCNRHDWRPKRGLTCEWPEWESREGHVKRSCIDVVALGKDCFEIAKGRTVVGRRLWIYAASGACVHFDVYLKFERSPYRAPSPYAPGEWPVVTAA